MQINLSRVHLGRSDEKNQGDADVTEHPDSSDRSATPTTPLATSPDDVLGTTSGGLRARNGNRPRSVCRSPSIVRARWQGALRREERSVESGSSAESASPLGFVC